MEFVPKLSVQPENSTMGNIIQSTLPTLLCAYQLCGSALCYTQRTTRLVITAGYEIVTLRENSAQYYGETAAVTNACIDVVLVPHCEGLR